MVATEPSRMILSAAVMHGLGMHQGAWLARDGEASDFVSPDLFAEVARTAEKGKLHAIFFADGITNAEQGAERPSGALDPVTLLMHMGSVTNRLGLVSTAATTFNDPYNLARRFASIDHLTRGRVGWNAVASFNPGAAAQFGMEGLPDHENRYARMNEFVDVVLALWDSWDEGALVGDKKSGVFAREEMIHEINHEGRFYSVRGPLPFPRTPQGRPAVFQAGSSSEGRDLAARTADVVFTAQHLLDGAIEFRADIRKRVAAYGRDPDSVKVLPGILPILGATETEAEARRKLLDEAVGTGPELLKLSRRVGVPVEALELDKPFPLHLIGPDAEFSGSVGFRTSLVNLAVKENLTVRGLLARYGGGHHQVVGTPEQLADIMARWMAAGAGDGFNLMVDMLPSGFHDVADMLVPVLQARGMFHTDYEHETLRENLGVTTARQLTGSAV